MGSYLDDRSVDVANAAAMASHEARALAGPQVFGEPDDDLRVENDAAVACWRRGHHRRNDTAALVPRCADCGAPLPPAKEDLMRRNALVLLLALAATLAAAQTAQAWPWPGETIGDVVNDLAYLFARALYW